MAPDDVKKALSLAGTLGGHAPLELSAVKEALLRSCDLPLDQGLRLERILRKMIGEMEHAKDGTIALLEKRKPRFIGK